MIISAPIALSIMLVGIVLTIVEAGLLILILKVYCKKEKNLVIMFLLTAHWGVYLVTNHLVDRYAVGLHSAIPHIIGTIPLIVFAFYLPKMMKFFSKPLLLISGSAAFIGVALNIISRIWLPELAYHLVLIVPTLLGYFMFMDATIKIIKK